MSWLKQSTAVTVPIGPIVDSTDGATAETGFTISQADIRLSKNGGAFAQTNNAAGASHMENGWYGVPLNTTDTNTLGELVVNIAESGGLQVWARFMVVPANVWDSLFGADKLQVHVDEMTAGIITATVIATDAIDADAIAANAIDAGAIATGAITAAKFAAGAIDAAAVAADAVAEIQAGLATAAALDTVDNFLDTEIAAILEDTGTTLPAQIAALNNITAASVLAAGDIDGFTLEQALKLVLAVLAGKVSGAATATNVFRAADDSVDRVTSTVDVDGNRSAVTLNAAG